MLRNRVDGDRHVIPAPCGTSYKGNALWVHTTKVNRLLTPLDWLILDGFPFTAAGQLNAFSSLATWDLVNQTIETPVFLALVMAALASISWTETASASAPASSLDDVEEAEAAFALIQPLCQRQRCEQQSAAA